MTSRKTSLSKQGKKPRKPSRLKHSKKVGMPPGALVHVGEIKTAQPHVTVFDYTPDSISELSLTAEEALTLAPNIAGIRWLNVYGLHDATLIARIGENFGLHALVLEDILNTNQRPKVDSFEHNLFVVTRFFQYHSEERSITSDQVSIILGKNFVLTFQERHVGAFDPIRERLRTAGSHLRQSGPDYLTYSLLDMIVDRYFIVLEQLSDDCEELEEALIRKPTNATLKSIHSLKRESMELRRNVWPLREVVSHLIRNEQGFFTATTVLYLRDVHDHTMYFIESLEAIRDMLSGMMDIYLSSVSNRVNLELRALTVVAMLFMPATLIAGIFGMNFEFIPWFHHPYGFWFALGIMVGIGFIMALIFWRRQWLSRADSGQ
ncbi:MAG: magnesium and cobalt transport protein CorA [Betaproteobacteria bacterium HGW-Betaproteobacteria-2]|nr:MAG: magnesium and cobalt transport protein CorA [Betaproteobacteria bacterium HGW-Betaproteobacteria-2]